jgi:hypothetical protein
MGARAAVGLILILIGGLLLMQAFGVTLPSRWWALLLLVPAAIALVVAWITYRREQRLSLASAAPFAGAVALVLLTLVILADIAITWSVIGPVALILVGAGLLGRGFH